jgi:hypothetical protein
MATSRSRPKAPDRPSTHRELIDVQQSELPRSITPYRPVPAADAPSASPALRADVEPDTAFTIGHWLLVRLPSETPVLHGVRQTMARRPAIPFLGRLVDAA